MAEQCPAELKSSGGCRSACDVYDTNEYCCNKAGSCAPTKYSRFFKRLCPNACSYATDDPTSTFTCSSGGDYMVTFCPNKQGISYEYGKGRLEDRSQLQLDIYNAKPTHIFNAAGVTGRPNVDWCESHRQEIIRTNAVGTLTLAQVCSENGLLLINYATGCIFKYDTDHLEGSGIRFKEEDNPNFTGSFYSKTKAMAEELLKEYDNVCTLRVRMPISSDLNNPRNFISKICRYNKVVNIPNSMTIMDELLPISIEMAKRNCRGYGILPTQVL